MPHVAADTTTALLPSHPYPSCRCADWAARAKPGPQGEQAPSLRMLLHGNDGCVRVARRAIFAKYVGAHLAIAHVHSNGCDAEERAGLGSGADAATTHAKHRACMPGQGGNTTISYEKFAVFDNTRARGNACTPRRVALDWRIYEHGTTRIVAGAHR